MPRAKSEGKEIEAISLEKGLKSFICLGIVVMKLGEEGLCIRIRGGREDSFVDVGLLGTRSDREDRIRVICTAGKTGWG